MHFFFENSLIRDYNFRTFSLTLQGIIKICYAYHFLKEHWRSRKFDVFYIIQKVINSGLLETLKLRNFFTIFKTFFKESARDPRA